MNVWAAAVVFVVSAAVTLIGAAVFAEHLDRVGRRLGLTDALIGVLTALAADGPELSSAVTALARGEHEVGLGVVVGSNAFNIAAMVGLGAILARGIRPRRASLALEAIVATTALATAWATVAGVVPAIVAVAVLLVVLVPYIALLAVGDRRELHLPLTRRAHAALRIALGTGLTHHETPVSAVPLRRTTALMAAGLTGIVAGSVPLVDSALALADHLDLSRAVVGVVVLAVLTSLPNASTALRLARMGRGDAVVSETMNSNTLNLVGGVLVPALIIGSALAATGTGAFVWLVAMTAVALLLLGRPDGIGGAGGVVLVGMYAAFLATSV